MTIKHTKGVGSDCDLFEGNFNGYMWRGMALPGESILEGVLDEMAEECSEEETEFGISVHESVKFTNWCYINRGYWDGDIEFPKVRSMSMTAVANVWFGIHVSSLSNFLKGTWKAPKRVRAEAIDLVKNAWKVDEV